MVVQVLTGIVCLVPLKLFLHKFFLGELCPALSDNVKGGRELKLGQRSKLCAGHVLSNTEGQGAVKPGVTKPCRDKNCLQKQEGLPHGRGIRSLMCPKVFPMAKAVLRQCGLGDR